MKKCLQAGNERAYAERERADNIKSGGMLTNLVCCLGPVLRGPISEAPS